MKNFFPFVYEKKKKEWEPEPMYIDLNHPPLEKNDEKEQKEQSKITVIQL